MRRSVGVGIAIIDPATCERMNRSAAQRVAYELLRGGNARFESFQSCVDMILGNIPDWKTRLIQDESEFLGALERAMKAEMNAAIAQRKQE